MRREAAGIEHEILFVDNGDGTTEALVRAHFPEVTVLPSRGNVGYGRGNNYLADHATGDLLVVINPDVTVLPGSLARLVECAAARPDVAAFAPVLRGPGGALSSDCFLTPPFFLNLLADLTGLRALYRKLVLAPRIGVERAVGCTSGAFFALRTSAWRALGGFDEGFFLYAEEMDLFMRMRAQGLAILRSPGVEVVHDVGSGQRGSFERLVYLCRGCMHFCRKHRPWPLAALAGVMLWLMTASRHVLRPGVRRPAEIRAFLWAIHPRRWWHGYGERG